MSSADSVFSCIKQEEAPHYAPPPPPPVTPGAPQKDDTDARKLAALEARVMKLEECSAAAASVAENYKTEALEARRRAAELEKRLAEMDAAINSQPEKALPGELETLFKLTDGNSARLDGVEKALRTLDLAGLNSLSLSLRLFEGRIESLEAGLSDELHERLSTVSSQAGEAARKAALAQETALAGTGRLEKLEKIAARLHYIENRFSGLETRLERLYELDALSQSLKLGAESAEGRLGQAMKECACVSGTQRRLLSDFESLSAQVRQMAALYNQFRTELAFLLPKKQPDTIGG